MASQTESQQSQNIANQIIHRFYTVPGKLLPLSETTLRRLVKDGKIKTVKLGQRATGITQNEIDRYLESIGAKSSNPNQ